MDKLLNWSLAQSDPATAAQTGAPDPELLAKLFAKADDPTLMKQSMQIIKSSDPEISHDDKIIAWENFEMLIENLDNAMNIENLKLWPGIIEELKSDDTEFQNLACSVIGTAVQNIEKAQSDFLKHDNGVKFLIELAGGTSGSSTAGVRLKAMYALSNLIRNNEKSYAQFNEYEGWSLIGPVLTDKEASDRLKLRSLSLLSALLSLTEAKADIFNHISQFEIIRNMLVDCGKESSISYVDKALNLLVLLIHCGYKYTETELKLIASFGELIETQFKDAINVDDYLVLKQVL
ncbi:hypothetical protein WICPIJ_001447 [Wickerhamomyces pijperi]|uniref:Hsp70 nucleotide exchange factor FES1 n=1 Tax=Wickerhamomyces pijperi TaxID=599730 RepID=A0A9P8QDH8_WICPI|nr:hypothetical protein WICPIJ_001447 [Wickerhamomyces pijperi]